MTSHNVEKATSGGVATKRIYPKFKKTHDIILENGNSLYKENRDGIGGRPRLWENPEELDEKIEQYHAYCKENNKPFLITGLAFYCGVDRKTLLEYSYRDEFLPTIQKMRHYAEFSMEEALLSGKAQVGAIFSLKNNFGWKDSKEVNVNESITISNIMGQVLNAPIDAIDGKIEEDEELLLDE